MSSTTSPNDPLYEGEGARSSGAFLAGEELTLAQDGFLPESIVDGPGLRCVVFVQGCPHACPGCHNPATHPFSGGQRVTVDQLLDKIHKSPLCRAVTLSGGEPFCQAGALAVLAKRLRAEGYELAAYTGYTFEQLLEGSREQRALLGHLHTLVDGPFIQSQKNLTLRFRGSENQRILDVPQSLDAGRAVWETHSRWLGEEGRR